MWSQAVELGEWTPDAPVISAPALRRAENVIARARGYDAWPTLVATGRGSLNTTCLGATSGRTRQGTDFIVAGTATKLYLATTAGFTDETRLVGGAYATDKRWDFALHGDDLIACNYVDETQFFRFATSTEFALLHANAPKAKHAAVVREFLVFANLIGQGTHAAIYGTREDGVHWGAQGDALNWQTAGTAAAQAVLSDWQPIVDDGGQITDLIGGADYGLIFKERSLWRMDFEGGSTFFRFTQVDAKHGCWVPSSAIRVGGLTYFLSETGVMVTDGVTTKPLGAERVDRHLRENLRFSSAHRVCAFQHPSLPLIGWAYQNQTSQTGAMNRILLYNWQTDRFSEITNDRVEWILEATEEGGSLDAAPYAATDMDASPGVLSNVSMDSITGGIERILSAFSQGFHALQTYTGAPATGTLETGDFELAPGRIAFVRATRPLFSAAGTALSVGVAGRFRSGDPTPAVTPTEIDATGKCAARSAGRYHSAKLEVVGAYEEVHGLSADFAVQGMR